MEKEKQLLKESMLRYMSLYENTGKVIYYELSKNREEMLKNLENKK